MAGSKFDLARESFESWPWMFGYQYQRVVDGAARNGIEECVPQIYLLAAWCRPFMDKPQRDRAKELKDKGSDWDSLYELLDLCLDVAQVKGTWEFSNEVEHFNEAATQPH